MPLTLNPLDVPDCENRGMDMTEHWEQRTNILDGLSAALAYMEDQIENLKSLIEDEVEEERTHYAEL